MPTCRMYNELSFIRDTISNRVTSSNLTLSNSQQSSSQSQSSISSAPISISPAPSPMNATIQNNNLSKNLYMPLEQQKNDHTTYHEEVEEKKIKGRTFSREH